MIKQKLYVVKIFVSIIPIQCVLRKKNVQQNSRVSQKQRILNNFYFIKNSKGSMESSIGVLIMVSLISL
jgi:hypothetical protein